MVMRSIKASSTTIPAKCTRPSFSGAMRLPPRSSSITIKRILTTVQRGKGKEVYHKEGDTEQGREVHQARKAAVLRDLARNLADTHDTRDAGTLGLPFDSLPDALRIRLTTVQVCFRPLPSASQGV